ncbi:hypothetical protein [Bradyrhizobium sp. BR 1432]|uniref:hypothetical protein n=1 Tax=Bradyrhizobium sp. BR 1432 TaxID=3447966 RepID=UPI003EE580AE
MAPFKNINPLDGDFATYNSTVQQPQQQQAEFEQHLNELHQADALNPDRELFDISEEDDRLIRAAADAALDRRGEPRAVTIGNYERSLRKLADALKPSGQTITMLDHKSLLDHAKRLFPRDKVIVPALSMLSRHREPDAPARPITPQYRASKEDEDLIRRAAEGNFCRTIGHQTGEDYANRLRKLSAALQPSSIAVLDHGSLVRHAKRLFPGNERLVYALNRLDDYRRRGASRRKRGGSRLALEPAANAPVQSVRQEQLLDTEASRSAGVAPPTVRRAVLNPYPNDLALIEAYKAAPAEGISEDTAINYANRLTGFSVHLRKKSKPGIAARLHDGSLDTDVKDYKDSDGRYVGAALAHFRKSLPHGALELGQHTDPEDAVARRVGKSPAQHSASEGSASGPEILLPAEGHDQDVISGMMDEADPSSLSSQPRAIIRHRIPMKPFTR